MTVRLAPVRGAVSDAAGAAFPRAALADAVAPARVPRVSPRGVGLTTAPFRGVETFTRPGAGWRRASGRAGRCGTSRTSRAGRARLARWSARRCGRGRRIDHTLRGRHEIVRDGFAGGRGTIQHPHGPVHEAHGFRNRRRAHLAGAQLLLDRVGETTEGISRCGRSRGGAFGVLRLEKLDVVKDVITALVRERVELLKQLVA